MICFKDAYVGMAVKYTGKILDINTIGIVIEVKNGRVLVTFPDEKSGRLLPNGVCLHSGYGLDPSGKSLYFAEYLIEFSTVDLEPINSEIINLEEE